MESLCSLTIGGEPRKAPHRKRSGFVNRAIGEAGGSIRATVLTDAGRSVPCSTLSHCLTGLGRCLEVEPPRRNHGECKGVDQILAHASLPVE